MYSAEAKESKNSRRDAIIDNDGLGASWKN